MLADNFKEFVVKIKYKGMNGSGVIFKPCLDSEVAYIFTAKHIFFKEKNAYHEYTEEHLELEKEHLDIIKEIPSKNSLKIKMTSAYFLSKINSFIDIALLIIEVKDNQFEDLGILNIFDSQNNNPDHFIFLALGYPQTMANSIHDLESLKTTYIHENTGNEEYTVKFRNTDYITNSTELNGLSGGGFFTNDKNENKTLFGIHSSSEHKNTLTCFRLDTLIDDINDLLDRIGNNNKINLKRITSSEKILIDKEELTFKDFSNFEFFKEKIKEQLKYNQTIKEIASNHNIDLENFSIDKKTIKEYSLSLKKQHVILNKNTEALSTLYAYLGVISHENSAHASATANFKTAILLNPKHGQTFLLERQRRINPSSNIPAVSDNSLKEKIDYFNEKIESIENKIDESNIQEKITYLLQEKAFLIKEGLNEIYPINNLAFAEIKKNTLDHFFSELEESYRKINHINDVHKYYELAKIFDDFQDKKEKSAYYFNLTKTLISLIPYQKSYNDILIKVNEKIQELQTSGINTNQHNEKIKEKAIVISKNYEDHNITSLLYNLKHLIGEVHGEVHKLKISNIEQDKSIEEIKILIDNNLIQQFSIFEEKRYNTELANNNLHEMNSALEKINMSIENAPNNYELIIDTETTRNIANEVITPFHEKLSDMDTTFEKTRETLNKIEPIIDNTENFLNNIANISKNDLKATTQELNAKAKEIIAASGINIEEIKKTVKDQIKESREEVFLDTNNTIKSMKEQVTIENQKTRELMHKKITESENLIGKTITLNQNLNQKNTDKIIEFQHEILNLVSKIYKINIHSLITLKSNFSWILIIIFITILLGLGFILDNISLYG